MDEVMFERCDSYEDRLRSVFHSFATDPRGDLGSTELESLCQHLQLSPESSSRLRTSLLRSGGRVCFEDFKFNLVSLLEDQEREKEEEILVVEEVVVENDQSHGASHRSEEAAQKASIDASDGTIEHLGHFLGEREALANIWARLDVGADGHLDRHELAKVCECVGMERLPEQVLDQLFSSLDLDGDGRVAFEDLLTLFQGGETSGRRKRRKQQDDQNLKSGHFSHHSSPHSDSLKQAGEHSFFSALDRENAGFADSSSICEYLETLGLTSLDARKLVKDFTQKSTKSVSKIVDLKFLTSWLEEEMEHASNNPSMEVTVRGGMMACQGEVRYLRCQLDNTMLERDKVRLDLNEANNRTRVLAQEIDEQNARMERASLDRIRALEQRYVDQIRELQSDLYVEKEQFLSLRTDFEQRRRAEWADQEERMKNEWNTIKGENERLEKENTQLCQDLVQVRAQCEVLQRDLDSIRLQKDSKLGDLEEEGQGQGQLVAELTQQLEELTGLNKDLKDRNDELNLQLEAASKESLERRSSAPTTSGGNKFHWRKPLLSGKRTRGEEDRGMEGLTRHKRRARQKGENKGKNLQEEDCFSTTSLASSVSSIEEEDLGCDDKSCQLESLGAELGQFDPRQQQPGLLHPSSGPTSLESVDDNLVIMGNHASGTAQVCEQPPNLPVSPREDEKLQLHEELGELQRKYLELAEEMMRREQERTHELERIRGDQKDVQEKYSKTLSEKSGLESVLRETQTAFAGLESEMEETQSRLLKALNELDKCKEKQERDEKRISEMHERLSNGSFDAGGTTLIRTNENVQIISVRGGHDQQHHQRMKLNSPCVSKVLVNSDAPNPPAISQPRVTSMTSSSSLSSASFCSLRPTSCKAAATAPSVSSTAQPASLPAMSLRRSRSTSSASATLTPPVPPPAQPLQVSQLEQHCRNLEGQLDSVKSEIIKILSDKTVASRENESLRHYASAYEELRTENEALRKELAQLNKLMVDPPKSPALSTSSKASSSDPQNVDRSSPDGQEELDTTSSSSTAEDTSKTDISKAEDDPKEDHASLESPESPIKADAILTKRCEELEESLELMRNEFENMEDYWQSKLEEERTFYENQIQSSEANFQDLESKMREYEELLLKTDGLTAHKQTGEGEEDKLSTIQETASLEGQVADLEDEISDLKTQLSSMQEQKYDACRSLEAEWSKRLSDESSAQKLALEAEWSKKLREETETAKTALGAEWKMRLDVETKAKVALQGRLKETEVLLSDSDLKLQKALHERDYYYSLQRHQRQPHPPHPQQQPQKHSSLPPNLNVDSTPLSDLERLRRLTKEDQKRLVQPSNNNQAPRLWPFSSSNPPSPPHDDSEVNGSLSLDSSFRMAVTDRRRLPQQQNSHAFTSLAKAYKAVFKDTLSAKKQSCNGDNTIVSDSCTQQTPATASVEENVLSLSPAKLLQVRLRQQEQHTRDLQMAFGEQQRHYLQILQATREQHQSEIEHLELVVRANQDILRTQIHKNELQRRRLLDSDNSVRHLVSQNKTLVVAIQTLEDSILDQSQ